MGLAERRKIKELQDNVLPGRVKEIEEICGAPIPYDVDWESFSDVASLRKPDGFINHDAPAPTFLRSEYLVTHRGFYSSGSMLLLLVAYAAMASGQS